MIPVTGQVMLLVLEVALAILHARVPFLLERAIVALLRKQWSASLLAVGGIALPFASDAGLWYLLVESSWPGGDPTKKAAVLAQIMPGLLDMPGFGLWFGVISWPFIGFLNERRVSTRRRQVGR